MRIDCEQCGAAFSIDDALISDRGVRAQCPKCGHQRVVKKAAGPNPLTGGPAPVTAVMPQPPPAANPFAGLGAPAAQSPFGAPPAGAAPTFGAPGGAVASPFGAPPAAASPFSGAAPLANPFAPPPSPTSTLPFGTPVFNPAAQANQTQPMSMPSMTNPFGNQATLPSGNPFSAPPTAPVQNPFAAPSSPPSAAPGPTSTQAMFGRGATPPPQNPFGGLPGVSSPPGSSGWAPPGFGPEPTQKTANPFGAAPSQMPTQPSGSPLAPPTVPSANPFGSPSMTASSDPFAAALGAAPAFGNPSVGAPTPAPMSDPFAALGASPPAPQPPAPAADPFMTIGAANAKPAMARPGGAAAASAIVVTPADKPVRGDRQRAPANPFDQPAPVTGGGAAADDPFARLDIAGPAKNVDSPGTLWHVRSQEGLDADVDLPQLKEMVKNGQILPTDEAAPAGENLRPVSSWPVLARPAAPAQKKPAAVRGVGSGRGFPTRLVAAAAAVVVVIGGAGAIYTLKPELFEKRTDAGVNPLRRAKPSWEKQFPEVGGTAQEHINAGRQQMRLDSAAGYRKADDELRQALLLDIGNTAGIAAWVENYTHLPAVHADIEGVSLAQEAIGYARRKEPTNADVQRADGALKLAVGEVDAAQKILTQAHTEAPSNMDTALVLAASHLERSPQDALELVQQVRSKDATLKHALVIEGAAQRRLGAYKEARDVLGARLIDDPGNTGALKELAKLELDVGNSEAAIQALTKLLEAEDRDIEAHLMRAKIAYQGVEGVDGLKRADAFLDIVLKGHDTAAGELLLPVLAHAAYVKAELGNLDEALKLGERARATDAGYPPALFVLGRIYGLKGNVEEAKKALEQAVRAAQTRDTFYEPVARAELARMLAASGNAADAIRNYEQVIEYDPRYARGYFGLAATYMTTARTTQAMTIMRRAFDNDPAFETDRKGLTDYPTSKHDLLAFADAFKNAKVAPGDESQASLKLASEGMIRYSAGQVNDAEALFKRTLAEDRFSDVALLYLAVIELGDGRAQEALKHLRLGTDSTAKNHSMSRMYLARAELRTGQLEAAKARLQDLIDQEPTLVQVQYTHAMALRQQHLEAPAVEELKKVLKADPDFTPAKRALAESP